MSNLTDPYIQFSGKYLESLDFTPQDFPEQVYDDLESDGFNDLSTFEMHQKINQTLLDAIESSEGEVFLLPKVVAYISRMREFIPTYFIGSFEFWLNQFSEKSDQEQSIIRAKIVGKNMPRSAYQKMFPVGKEKRYSEPHFSFAHYSTDLDTTIASFFSFTAAFGARITSSRHHWMVPGGPPKGNKEIEFVFKRALGEEVFEVLSRDDKLVQITSLDLLTQENIEKRTLSELSYDVDHARSQKAVVVVKENGHYIGDWRHMDVDPVRSIISRFWRMLIEHQNAFHIGLISLFAKKELAKEDLKNFAIEILDKKFADCHCSKEFASEHRKLLDTFIKEVVGVQEGFQCTFDHLVTKLEQQHEFIELKKELISLSERPFFNQDGRVTDDRSVIFEELEKVISNQKEEFRNLVRYFDTLEIAHKIKRKVLGLDPTYLGHLAELDQIREMMGDYSHLTVTYKEGDSYNLLGVIHRADLQKKTLAIASWNDFSNPSETDSREEIEVISFIDHHKSEVKSMRPAAGIIMDAQSSNTIIANLLFEMNDKFSNGAMSLEKIESQILEVKENLQFSSNVRVMKRLMTRKDAMMQNKQTGYYVSKDREVLEYLQCIFAILDDTDLLTKVTAYDVETMCSLVNRLKSLLLQKEVEVVNFDDILRSDPEYVSKAAKKLLRTQDLYSLYSFIYQAKEDGIEQLIVNTAKGYDTEFFQDSKVLSQYAYVTQFKHFIKNSNILKKKMSDLNKIWVERCKRLHKENQELQLFMCMMSTISSAEELFTDHMEDPTYQDELWLILPENEKRAETYLRKFITGFVQTGPLKHEDLKVELPPKCKRLESLCVDAFGRPFEKGYHKLGNSTIVLKLPQKKVVSRKTDIATYL